MKKTKVISCLLAATLIAASFAGCGDTASASTDDTSQKQEQQQPQEQKGTMAKVVSLEGDQITVLLADMPADNGGGGTPPSNGGTTDSATQTDGKTPPSAPPDGGGKQGGTPPDGQSGATPPSISTDGSDQQGQSGQPRQGGGQIQFTGEQVTYTLSDDIKVTKGMGDSAIEIDLSKIAADSVISFTTTTDADGNEVISSIQVME